MTNINHEICFYTGSKQLDISMSDMKNYQYELFNSFV